jgi:hypothetical protein
VADPEVKEVNLHERRRVAEELDVPIDDLAREIQAGALQPCADDADQDRQHNAREGEFQRGKEAADEPLAVERVVENRQVDAGRIVEPAEPVEEFLHALMKRS